MKKISQTSNKQIKQYTSKLALNFLVNYGIPGGRNLLETTVYLKVKEKFKEQKVNRTNKANAPLSIDFEKSLHLKKYLS